MPSEFGGVVTLYNRIMEGPGERWRRTTLSGAALTDRRGEAIRHSGAASSSARRIGPVTVSELTVLLPKAGRTGYMSPWEWRQTRLHEGRWTLQPGDVLVPGSCSVEVEESIGELMERCDRVAVIGAVTDFDGPGEMSHWEVTAR